MKIVYVAGPFRGATAWNINVNVLDAERWGLDLARLGAMPLVPHLLGQHMHGQCNEEFWLEGVMELLRRSDGVLLITGWEASSGARAEKLEAERLGLAVFESYNFHARFRAWIAT